MDHSLPLCGPWDFPGKNIGVGCHFLPQGIFPTQGLNPGLLHCREWLMLPKSQKERHDRRLSFKWLRKAEPHSRTLCSAAFKGQSTVWYHSEVEKVTKLNPHFLKLIYFNWIITLQYCGAFCHTSTGISHGCTCVPPSPMLTPPPHPIPLGWPRAPALSALLHALSLHWSSVLHMVIYMFHCCSPKSSHSFSHRVQKSVFTYCVSVAALHIGLSLLSF